MKYFYIVVFLIITFISCDNPKKFIQNRFVINKVAIVFVDYLGKDSLGCDLFVDFDSNRDNELSGVGFFIDKEFLSDSLKTNQVLTHVEKGLDGPLDKIINIQIREASGLELNNLFLGKDNLHTYDPVLYVDVPVNSYQTKTCDMFNPFFKNIKDFISAYNSNNRSISGQRLAKPIFFWIPKKEFKSKITGDSLEVVFDTNRSSAKKSFKITSPAKRTKSHKNDFDITKW